MMRHDHIACSRLPCEELPRSRVLDVDPFLEAVNLSKVVHRDLQTLRVRMPSEPQWRSEEPAPLDLGDAAVEPSEVRVARNARLRDLDGRLTRRPVELVI